MLRDLYISRGPAAGFVAVGLYWGAFAALVPDLKPQVGLTDGEFGLAMLVSAVGAVMAMWLAPLVQRRLGARDLPLAGLAMAAAFLLPGLAPDGVVFALCMMGAAMASGTLDVTMNARLSMLEEQSRRSLMNLNHGLFSIGYAVSALATGLAREAGWTPFMVFAALGVPVLALCVQMARAPVRETPRAADALPAAPLSWALLAPLGLIVLLGFMAEQGTEGWSALHLERGLGAGAAAGALGPAILGLTMAAGRFGGQMVAQRVSEAVMLRGAAVMTAVGAVVAAWAPGLAVAYIGFAVLGFGVSVVAPMAFSWCGRLVPSEHKALAISRVAVMGYAGFFVGPPLMGGLSEAFGLAASFTVVGGLMLVVPLVLVPMAARAATRGAIPAK
ncbi:MFS transporter [Maliponia aquimaris]|uniref:Inner membrane protein YbjJ n=1 Tax=Maliponia aquimaris TaxID=1673631 RepID=A0A238KU19_9RHOB|nr:MFS transporter [Maliponia aquimaris]SMX46081.1 Inner membrane protein YbjJ [Maliponia aquimaris]